MGSELKETPLAGLGWAIDLNSLSISFLIYKRDNSSYCPGYHED